MSDHGVDLYRSDTGRYMQWPGPLAVATLPAQPQQQRGRPGPVAVGHDPVLDAAPAVATTVPRAWVFATRDPMDRRTLTLTLVNWMILVVLMCGFLLAKTVPTDAALTGGAAGPGVTATPTR